MDRRYGVVDWCTNECARGWPCWAESASLTAFLNFISPSSIWQFYRNDRDLFFISLLAWIDPLNPFVEYSPIHYDARAIRRATGLTAVNQSTRTEVLVHRASVMSLGMLSALHYFQTNQLTYWYSFWSIKKKLGVWNTSPHWTSGQSAADRPLARFGNVMRNTHWFKNKKHAVRALYARHRS